MIDNVEPAKITRRYAKTKHNKRRAGNCSRPSFCFFGTERWFLLPIAFAVPTNLCAAFITCFFSFLYCPNGPRIDSWWLLRNLRFSHPP